MAGPESDGTETQTLLAAITTAAVLVVGIPALAGTVLQSWRPYDPVADELTAVAELKHTLKYQGPLAIPIEMPGVCVDVNTQAADPLDEDGYCPSLDDEKDYAFSYQYDGDVDRWQFSSEYGIAMAQVPDDTPQAVKDCIDALIEVAEPYNGAAERHVPNDFADDFASEMWIDDHLRLGGTFCLTSYAPGNAHHGGTVAWFSIPAHDDTEPKEFDATILLWETQ